MDDIIRCRKSWHRYPQIHQLWGREGKNCDSNNISAMAYLLQGFLRRVHRYPVYMPPDPSEPISSQLIFTPETFIDPFANSELARKRSKSQGVTSLRLPAQRSSIQVDPADTPIVFPKLTPEITSHETPVPVPTPAMSATHRARRASAAEKVLGQLRSRDMQKSGSALL